MNLFSWCSQNSAHTELASGLWRSESMVKFDLTLPREVAHDTVFQLGLLGCTQFVDCLDGVAAFQRPFTSDIRRCEEVERRLRYIGDHCRRSGVVLASVETIAPTLSPKASDHQRDSTVPTLRRREREEQVAYVPQASMACLDRVETSLDSKERDLRALVATLSNLRRDIKAIKEALVVQAVQQDANQGEERVIAWSMAVATTTSDGSVAMTAHPATTPSTALHNYGSYTDGGGGVIPTTSRSLCGVIGNDRIDLLSRLVYRISRGNSVIRSWGIQRMDWLMSAVDRDGDFDACESDDDGDEDDSGTSQRDAPVSQSVFVVYCHAPRMLERLRRVCISTGGKLVSDDQTTRQLLHDLHTLQSTYTQSRQRKRDLLMRCGAEFLAHSRFLRLQKSVLSSLNLLQFSGSLCRAVLWCPARREPDVRAALSEATRTACSDAPTIITPSKNQRHPPTFFEANKYIAIFQGIVDSYGVARYKEINPGVFTIITFPYLFGIMYGDVGHGVLLTLVAIGLIAMEKAVEGTRQNEIFSMIFSGRYLLLLMGLFATYIGLLYNDFFGYSIGLFESSYTWPEFPEQGGPGGLVHPLSPNGRPSVKPDSVYPFGIDVAWSETENKLEFYNSVKMKCAVIVGVIQMLAGIVLSLFNYLRDGQRYKVWFLFLPQFLFMTCTFGYMALMIVIKWTTVWPNTHDAPSLLETMTNFFLSPGTVAKPLYAGQGAVQTILLVLSFSMTPIMLLVPSAIEKRQLRHGYKRMPAVSCVADERPRSLNSSSGTRVHEDEATVIDGSRVSDHHDEDDDHEAHDPTEITIHYIIHTIEFVLGAVSNTASYLRLWALSLAHAQLSEVFFRFGVVQVIGSDTTGIMTFIGIGVWLGATVGVLLGMEALSAFLHSLRLHWVEFQSKFYLGDGVAFSPLDLVAICSDDKSD